MKKKIKCWEYFQCKEEACPVYVARELKCWLVPGTHCRQEIQGKFLEKIEMCLACEPFKANIDLDSMEETLEVVHEQFVEFRKMVEDRDRELEGISMELAVGLSEAFEGLSGIASGDPETRIDEKSELELISKLKRMVNLTAEDLGEIVGLSHEFAIGLAEHFDVLHRVSQGNLAARVTGVSQVELLESLKKMTNDMIESVSREISERERAELAMRKSESELRESEEKYHTLFDYDPNSIFVLEPGTLRILDVNQRGLEVYGYEKEEIVGKSFRDLGRFEYIDGVFCDKTPNPLMKYSVYPKVQHLQKGGKPFYVNVHACKRKRQRKYGIVATTVDITESLEKETQLMQAGKMSTLGEMATGVAHELNQPLTALQIAADFIWNMCREQKPIPEDLLDLISQQIKDQISRAVGIINHLRQFGRKGEAHKEEIDINEPLRGVFTLLGQQLKVRGIRIVLDLHENMPPIVGNSHRLEQVFIDIVMNARDAMEERRKRFPSDDAENTLTVRSFRENGSVAVTIADTGIGIPDENREKIFEPFFTTKKVGDGTGLGLSISYGIVKDHGGTIAVESAVGKGTAFTLSFPACEGKDAGK
jgi:PAS domain S-box-containing protein